MSKPSKNTQRAYAIASYIGASLKTYEVNDPELDRLHLQVKRAMRVYTKKVGADATLALADKLGDLWVELGAKHSATIDEDSVPALIEAFCMVLPPKEFKDFLGIPPYYKEEHQFGKHYKAIMKSTNGLNSELNKLLGTKSVIMQKPKIKVPKIKKPRVKVKSKAQKAHEKRIADERGRQERVSGFLRDRIAKNKGQK